MPNTLATLSPAQLLAKRIVAILNDTYHYLPFLGGDFSDENAEYGRTIKVKTPGNFTAADYSTTNGYVVADASVTEKDLVINNFKHVTYAFNDVERASTSAPLIEMHAQSAAAALGKSITDALLALVVPATYTNATTKALASFDRKTIIETNTALNNRKVSPIGRICLLNSTYYAKLCEDGTLVANAGSPSDAVRSGLLGNVHGQRVFEVPQLPVTSNLTGFSMAPGAILFATRTAPPPEKATFPGTSEIVTHEETGLSISCRTWYDPQKGAEIRSYALLFGVAAGDPARLQRIVSA